ncbi:Rgg/GadR/MutR family transcriptional regulator, partial [Streptococcus sp. TATVAM-FAB21]
MKYLGQAFKELREARHISLANATGGYFSPSMLSKFESGKHDLSAQKLLIALENAHIEINEFLYLTRGFLKSDLVELQEKIYSLEEKLDQGGLQKLYESEQNKQNNRDTKMLYTIIIKAHMKAFDETTELTSEEETFLYNYLFNTEIWGNHELSLFSICSTLLSPELFTMYARECLR